MEIEERRNRKSRLRRIELVVWIVIIIIISLFGTFIHFKHENSFKTHTIYMPDVDGLIVGSPVQMMGISIGYINQVKIINDSEIKVRFKLTNKSITIPKNTFATVEFSGLGGSKSLVLYPPDSGKFPKELVGKNDYILVDRPRRLRDSMALLYQMYKTLMNIIYTSANFSNEIKKVELPESTTNMMDFSSFINYADGYMNTYNENMKSIRKMINKYSSKQE